MRVRDNLVIGLGFVALLWIIYFLGVISPLELRIHGIIPRTVQGLPGILFSPFLHAGVGHLLSNSVALAVLLPVSLIYSRKLTLEAIVIIVLLGGGLVWLLGASNTAHIGASGIIFGLIGYLLAIGIFRRELLALAVSLLVAFYYGWTLSSLFVVLPGISWSSHFFGFASGVCAAWLTRNDAVR